MNIYTLIVFFLELFGEIRYFYRAKFGRVVLGSKSLMEKRSSNTFNLPLFHLFYWKIRLWILSLFTEKTIVPRLVLVKYSRFCSLSVRSPFWWHVDFYLRSLDSVKGNRLEKLRKWVTVLSTLQLILTRSLIRLIVKWPQALIDLHQLNVLVI